MSKKKTGLAAAPDNGDCWFCSEFCTDENFCFGCEEFICDECMEDECEGFTHTVEEHMIEDDE